MSYFPGSDILNTVKKVQRQAHVGPAYNKDPMGLVGPVGAKNPRPSRGGRAAAVAKVAARNKGRAPAPTNNYNINNPGYQPTKLTGDTTVQDTTYPGIEGLTDNSRIAGLAGTIQLPNASKYANAMADMQYGSKVQALTDRIKGLTAALPGSLQALDTAFKNIDAARVPVVTNAQTSGQGVANLFGNNTSAAGVAANQSAQASATAANQAGQLTDESQAAGQRQADWATRIQLLNNLAVNQTQSDLIGTRGEQSAAKKGYYDQALKTRGDMISQAIANQGALNNQRVTSALAQAQIDQAGAKTTGLNIQNAASRINLLALPPILQNQINSGKLGITTSLLTNSINTATARAQLKQLQGQDKTVRNTRQAAAAGGSAALYGMILPSAAVVQNADTGKPTLNGDPNVYYRNGVAALHTQFPHQSMKSIKLFVQNQLSQVVAETGWGNYKNGRWVKLGKGK